MRRFSPRKWFLLLTALAAVSILTSPVARGSDLRRTATVRAVARAQASVVNIRGEKTVGAELQDRQLRLPETGRRVNGMGSGVVIDPRGYVLTNSHVVHDVRKIRVTLANGQVHSARIIAKDETSDLAIIRILGVEELPVLEVGTSSDLMLGELVIAIGNPYGYEHSVTRGIVSQLRRTVQVTDTLIYEDLIQTDAPINPGNSGGPLMNADGKLIGVVVAVRAGAQGISFAIPVDRAMDAAADMLRDRRQGRVWHGATLADDTTDPENLRLVVESVEQDSPAERGGMKPGDVITNVGGTAARRRLDLERVLLGFQSGTDVPLSLNRNGEIRELTLKLAQDRGPAGPAEETDSLWRVLGLKLEPVSAAVVKQYNDRYRGGLRVMAVRAGSPASADGIRRGDILLGMHHWETVSLDNLRYILNRHDLEDLSPLKFYIIRDNETLFGYLRVSMLDEPRR